MQAWKLLLCRILVSLVSIIVLNLADAEAGQQIKNNSGKLQPKSKLPPKTKINTQASPIIGELEDTDTMPIEDDESTSDEEDEAPNPKNSKVTPQLDKENRKNKKRDIKKEKILEGFKQAQQFHMSWHNLPSTKIKTSHENLVKFCKVACTKKHCLDKQVADKCHLMCPEETTGQCPDPIKEAQDIDGEEVTIGNDDSVEDYSLPTDGAINENNRASSKTSLIEQAERNIEDSDGEEG
jgi:hypothetical protein